ncbi:hypothetical protein ACVWXM_007967 [Bradyrhizobium sp. GM7.3]
MKLVKSLLLGSAAGLLAVGGAQAADLPVKAKAVEYVKICSLYGAGFYYIPGTDTCIKLGGYLRAEVALNTNSDFSGQFTTNNGSRNRLTNYYTMRAREDLNIDTRTATEYGVVRTFFDGVFSWTTGNYNGTGSAFDGTAYSSTLALNTSGVSPALVGSSINGTDGATSGGSLGVYYAFIQFAGFTMGKAVSQFDAPWTNYPGNNFDGLVGGSGTVTGVNQFTYTADFGQGVTASFSAEDATNYYQAGNQNLSGASVAGIVGGANGTNAIGGSRSPNLVAMVRVDQAWGLFQASVAAHDNHVAYYGATEVTGHPDDKWGWAAQLALSIKNIPTGAGDVINIQGVYTDGATRYNFQNLAAAATRCSDLPALRTRASASPMLPTRCTSRAPSRSRSRPGASAVPTPITGIHTGTPRSTVPTLRRSTVRWARPLSAVLVARSSPARLWLALQRVTLTSPSARSVSSPAGPRSRT